MLPLLSLPVGNPDPLLVSFLTSEILWELFLRKGNPDSARASAQLVDMLANPTGYGFGTGLWEEYLKTLDGLPDKRREDAWQKKVGVPEAKAEAMRNEFLEDNWNDWNDVGATKEEIQALVNKYVAYALAELRKG
jgi:hypothetical protein